MAKRTVTGKFQFTREEVNGMVAAFRGLCDSAEYVANLQGHANVPITKCWHVKSASPCHLIDHCRVRLARERVEEGWRLIGKLRGMGSEA